MGRTRKWAGAVAVAVVAATAITLAPAAGAADPPSGKAAGCSTTAAAPGPVPEFHPGAAPTAGQVGAVHVHGSSAGSGTLPATGGQPAPLAPLLLGAGLTVAAVARLARRPS